MASGALRVAAIGTFALILTGVPALAVELQPGLWEVSSRSERAGVVQARPAKTRCLTPEKAREAATQTSMDLSKGGRGEGCKTVESRKTDNGLTWRMQCVGLIAAEQTGSFAVENPQRYTAVLKTTATIGSRSLTSTLTVEARRIGECPK